MKIIEHKKNNFGSGGLLENYVYKFFSVIEIILFCYMNNLEINIVNVYDYSKVSKVYDVLNYYLYYIQKTTGEKYTNVLYRCKFNIINWEHPSFTFCYNIQENENSSSNIICEFDKYFFYFQYYDTNVDTVILLLEKEDDSIYKNKIELKKKSRSMLRKSDIIVNIL